MPKNKNPEETVEKILDASLRLFIKKGFDRTTINDIVGELDGMTRGAFYHHFESKREVLYALLEKKYDAVERQTCDSMTGLERIRTLMNIHDVHVTPDTTDAQLLQITFDLLKDPIALAEQIKENYGPGSEWMRELVVLGMEDGSIKKQDADMLTQVILLLLNFWLIPTIYPVETVEEFEIKLLMAKKILDGLGCPVLDDAGVKSMMKLADRFSND